MREHYLVFAAAVLTLVLGGCGKPTTSQLPDAAEAPAAALAPALEFRYPDRFAGDRSYATVASSVAIKGGLTAVLIPDGYCPDRKPPQDYRLAWTNEATGQHGAVDVWVYCIAGALRNISRQGIDSRFRIAGVGLEPGSNPIRFDTFRRGSHVGADTVFIVRQTTASVAAAQQQF